MVNINSFYIIVFSFKNEIKKSHENNQQQKCNLLLLTS